MVDTVLDISVHESCQIIYGIINAMIGYAALRIVVCADFGRTVTGAYPGLTFRGNVINIF